MGDTLRGFMAGTLAAIAAGAVTHPIDLIKVRMQLTQAQSQSMRKVAWEVIRKEGPLALFNGISGNVLRQAFFIGSRLGFYNVLKKRFEDEKGRLSFVGKVLCGLAAGALGSLIGNPADLTMVRMQADGRLPPELRRNYKHAFDALRRISAEEGVTALWRGAIPTMNRAMIVTAAQMSCYDQSKEYLVRNTPLRDGPIAHTFASLIAGGVAAIASNPFDVAKTRLQNMGGAGADSKMMYMGTWDCMVKTVKTEGATALYKGLTATWARQAPLNVVRFLALEQLNRLFEGMGLSPVIISRISTKPACDHGPFGTCDACLTRRSKLLLSNVY